MDQVVLEETRQQVLEKCQSGEPFSAWNITMTLRGQGYDLQHREVRDVVHSMFRRAQMYGYTRELKGTEGSLYWLYYRIDGCPTQQHATIDQSVPVVPDCTALEARTDYRGTLCIPATAAREAGFVPGLRVIAVPRYNTQEIRVFDPRTVLTLGFPSESAYYTVDKYYNVRITKSVLQAAQMYDDFYKVEVRGNLILVSRKD